MRRLQLLSLEEIAPRHNVGTSVRGTSDFDRPPVRGTASLNNGRTRFASAVMTAAAQVHCSAIPRGGTLPPMVLHPCAEERGKAVARESEADGGPDRRGRRERVCQNSSQGG